MTFDSERLEHNILNQTDQGTRELYSSTWHTFTNNLDESLFIAFAEARQDLIRCMSSKTRACYIKLSIHRLGR